jgi:para-aminobenzoate synthetase/4-amino-4-deoxychorismate lyase
VGLTAVIRDAERNRWLLFQRPVDVIATHDLDSLVAEFERAERAVHQGGLCAAGFLAYEAAPAFDQALQVRPPDPQLPLLHFALYRRMIELEQPPAIDPDGYSLGDWQPSISRQEHRRAVDRIRAFIRDGDTYQVNFSFRLRAAFNGDPWSLFLDLQRAQQAPMAAFIDTGTHAICSASPELFLGVDGEKLTSRPMKGTADRGHNTASDREREQWLRSSVKNRAENAMIVDMVRSDMGRIAEVGSVEVSRRFEVERYPTVLQMTSTVTSRSRASVAEIVAAMFPYASITGAPKVRTMEIIRELEAEPRGVYTGAVGFLAPRRRAQLNVAIRTVVVDRDRGRAEYGVGGGILWDSKPEDEYRECRVKAAILTHQPPDFELLETILWEPSDGYFLLDRHLGRIGEAAQFFVRPLEIDLVKRKLRELEARLPQTPHRVRLLVNAAGQITLESTRVASGHAPHPVRLGLAAEPVDSSDPFLHFKTTHRAVYDRARAGRPDCDDVLLYNERGELTESTVANLVLRLDGRLVTPPTSSGLLAGTYRQALLESQEIVERVVPLDDLARAESIHLINSVHRWIDVCWVDAADYSPGT